MTIKEDDLIKYCRYCGNELTKNEDGKLTCIDHNLLLRVPNDKYGFLTYIINLLSSKAKGKALNEAYSISKAFFLTKLLSFVVAATVAVSAVTSTISVVNSVKNKELLETGKLPEKVEVMKTFDLDVEVFESEDDYIQEVNKVEEITDDNVEEIVEPVEEIPDENIEEQQIEENIQPNNQVVIEPDYAAMNEIVNYMPVYFDYINDGNDRDLFLNGSITDGGFYNATKGLPRTEFDNFGTLWNAEEPNSVYMYRVKHEGVEGDEEVFAKIIFEKANGRYYLVADEPYSSTTKEAMEQYYER